MEFSEIVRVYGEINKRELWRFTWTHLRARFRDDCADMPLVTVVVPLYNEERFVKACLRSLIRQTYRNFECIIVNDCSTDRSVEIVNEYIAGDNRFRVVSHEVNMGLASSRNTGLLEARGEFITFLDSDDYLFRHSLRSRALALNAQKHYREVIGTYCKLFFVPETGKTLRSRVMPYLPVKHNKVNYLLAKGECPFNAHAPMLITERLRSFGTFDAEMRDGAEDWDLWMRLLRHGYTFMPSGDFGGAYRQKRRSMVRTLTQHHVREGSRIYDWVFFKRLGQDEIVQSTPFVYTNTFEHYTYQIVKARRLALYATIAFMARDIESYKKILAQFSRGTAFFITKFVSIETTIELGIARFVCDGLRRSPSAVAARYGEERKKILHDITNRIR